MKIILNLRDAKTPEEAQTYLQRALAFPDYYGKNLDALFDLLSVRDIPAVFVLRLPETGEMAAYGKRLRRVFEDACSVNKRISVR